MTRQAGTTKARRRVVIIGGGAAGLTAAIAAALLEATGQPCRITEIRPASGPHRRPVLSLWRSSAIMEGLESLNNTNWSSR